MSQNRPLRLVHRSDEWTAEKIAEHAIPALKKDFYSLQDIWPWTLYNLKDNQ